MEKPVRMLVTVRPSLDLSKMTTSFWRIREPTRPTMPVCPNRESGPGICPGKIFEKWYQEAKDKLNQARSGALDGEEFKAWLKK